MDLDSYNGIMDNTNGVYSSFIHASKSYMRAKQKFDNGKNRYSLFRHMKKEERVRSKRCRNWIL